MAQNALRAADTVQDTARAAFLERGQKALQRLAGEMTDDMLLTALAASSDIGSLAVAIGDGRLDDPALRIDPLAPAVARSLEHRQVLAAMAGPMLSSPEAAAALGLSRAAIDKRRLAGRIFALRIGSDWRYPAFQFEEGSTLPGLDRVLAAQAGRDSWSVLDLLLAADDAWGGRSLLDLLRQRDGAALDRALRQIAADGFA